MSNKSVCAICITIIVCCFLICDLFKSAINRKSNSYQPKTDNQIQQKPINLEELLTPKSIFPDTKKLEMPNSKNSTYAG